MRDHNMEFLTDIDRILQSTDRDIWRQGLLNMLEGPSPGTAFKYLITSSYYTQTHPARHPLGSLFVPHFGRMASSEYCGRNIAMRHVDMIALWMDRVGGDRSAVWCAMVAELGVYVPGRTTMLNMRERLANTKRCIYELTRRMHMDDDWAELGYLMARHLPSMRNFESLKPEQQLRLISVMEKSHNTKLFCNLASARFDNDSVLEFENRLHVLRDIFDPRYRQIQLDMLSDYNLIQTNNKKVRDAQIRATESMTSIKLKNKKRK